MLCKFVFNAQRPTHNQPRLCRHSCQRLIDMGIMPGLQPNKRYPVHPLEFAVIVLESDNKITAGQRGWIT